MASREIRRITQKKGDQAAQKTQVDIRKEKHPALFIGSIIVFAIIAITFIGGGVFYGNIFENQQRMFFGKYAGKPIYYDPLNYFGLKQRAAVENLNNDTSQNQFTDKTRQVWQNAYTETVKHEAILDRAKESGYYVSENAVDKSLLSYPYYQDENGKFSEKRYNEKSRREKDATKALYRELLIESTYTTDIFDSRYFSKGEMDFYRNMQNNERAIKFIEYDFDEYPDEKVKEYGKEHLKDFSRIKLSRILLIDSNLADANNIINMYNSNQRSFEDLASEYSRDYYAEQKGDMGIQFYYQIRNFFEETKKADQLADDIFKLQEGNVSAPIQVGKNWAIFKANSNAEAANLDDEETIKGIRSYILNYKKSEIQDYITSEADKLIEDGKNSNFETAASAAGKTVYETEFFPLNYLSIFFTKNITVKGDDSGRLNGAADKEAFFETVFSLKENEISQPVTLDNKIIIIKLDGVKTVDPSSWETENTTMKSYVSYIAPGMLNMVDKEDVNYLYLYMAYNYFQQDFNNVVIDKKKFEDDFNASFSRYFAISQ